jgi:membrane protease YdiL (CAAX protease family)
MFLVALIFTPIQCLSEELLFRSLFYTVAKRTKISAHLISIISALFFTLAHITNVEILSSTTPILILSYYFLSGFFFMEIVFAYKGIEVALGAHIMNNFFITTLVNYTDSSIHSYPFITIGSPNIFIDLFLLIISSSILLFLPSRAKRVVEPF